jgi:hypothetical protein
MKLSANNSVLLALAPLAVTTVLATERPAQAILTYYIYESSNNVVVETSGSINLPTYLGTIGCSATGVIDSSSGIICTGDASILDLYSITGPGSFGSGGQVFGSSSTGLGTGFSGNFGSGIFGIDPSYISGDPIISSVTFNNTTLSGLGINTTGLLGTWTLAETFDTIELRTGAAAGAPAAVPGPLPLFGAAAAFGYSRRLRRRLSQGRVAPDASESTNS